MFFSDKRWRSLAIEIKGEGRNPHFKRLFGKQNSTVINLLTKFSFYMSCSLYLLTIDFTSTPLSQRSMMATCALVSSDWPLPTQTSTFGTFSSSKCRTTIHSTVCPLDTAISRLRQISSGSHNRE